MSRLHSVPHFVLALVIVAALALGAAGGALAGGVAGYTLASDTASAAGSGTVPTQNNSWSASAPIQTAGLAVQQTAAPAPAQPAAANPITAEDQLLEQLYQKVNPSVVNISVTSNVSASTNNFPNMPQIPGLPFGQGQGQGQGQNFVQQAEGSGWVYDTQGDIVTNNHVVDGATRITVTFYDDRSVTAKLVAADPNSDLAVIKVDPTGLDLKPLELGSSQNLKVGESVIAIGNPFGLEGTMTQGIVSALGRSLPAGQATSGGATYTIPDVIQTDAAINPGNSGGPLMDINGNVVGVTSAIESPVRANSGVGFAIPARILKMVVPVLVKGGTMEYSWIGISGTTLNPQLNQAMNLSASQRGVLVVDVSQGGPAAKANLQGSSQTANIDGQQVKVGGDIIVGIDNQTIQKFDDLLTYLLYNTKVGQQVTLKVLHNGTTQDVTLTLAARPSQTQASSLQNNSQQ